MSSLPPGDPSQAQPLPAEAAERSRDRGNNVVTAIIALVAALLGSGVGGVATYLSTHDQIKNQVRQSQTDFLRSQRQIAYAALVNDVITLSPVEFSYAGDLLAAATDKDKPLPPIPGTYTREIDQLNQDSSVVQIVGSTQAAKKALTLAARLNVFLLTSRVRLKAYERTRPTQSMVDSASALDRSLENGILDSRTEFITAARTDIVS
jgi:hypothetical protein